MQFFRAPKKLVGMVSLLLLIGVGFWYLLQQRTQEIQLEGSAPANQNTAPYQEATIGTNKLITISGIIEKIETVEKNYPIAPVQEVITIRVASNPKERYAISLGGPKNGLIYRDATITNPTEGQIIEQSVITEELIPKLSVGDSISVELDITAFPADFAQEIKQSIIDQHQQALTASDALEPVELYYFVVGKIILEAHAAK